jgi:ATP-dependent protease ClpP protease subunit
VKTPPPPPRFRREVGSRPESSEPWEISVAGELSDKQVDLIHALIDVPFGSRGTIWFESCGGSAYVGLALASLIRLRGLDATAVALGECSSAALMPFAACPRRFVTPHTTLFFHPVRWSSEEDVNLQEAAEWTRHFQTLEADLDGLLARLFEMPVEKLSAWTRPGKFMTGLQMAEAGLAKLVDLFAGDLRKQLNQ